MCNGPTHRIAGVAAWLAVAPVLPVAPWQLVAGAFVAGATANGRLSPDCDQAYYLSSRLIPGGHREITHLWVLPLLMFGAGLNVGAQGWLLLAAAVAWASHDVIDAPFGRVPIWYARGRWVRAGGHLKTGGLTELWVAMPLLLLAVPALAAVDLWRNLGGALVTWLIVVGVAAGVVAVGARPHRLLQRQMARAART